MAKRLGCTPTTYFRYERGERRVFLDQAKAIASFLACSIDELGTEPTDEEQLTLLKRAQIRRRAIELGDNPDDAEVEAELLNQWPGGEDE
jgi:transcriptional regulator with XRE-family HTH domain